MIVIVVSCVCVVIMVGCGVSDGSVGFSCCVCAICAVFGVDVAIVLMYGINVLCVVVDVVVVIVLRCDLSGLCLLCA